MPAGNCKHSQSATGDRDVQCTVQGIPVDYCSRVQHLVLFFIVKISQCRALDEIDIIIATASSCT